MEVLLKTKLKSGYTWILYDDGIVRLLKFHEDEEGNPIANHHDEIEIDKVRQYSLLSFLVRVFRHRGIKRRKKLGT